MRKLIRIDGFDYLFIKIDKRWKHPRDAGYTCGIEFDSDANMPNEAYMALSGFIDSLQQSGYHRVHIPYDMKSYIWTKFENHYGYSTHVTNIRKNMRSRRRLFFKSESELNELITVYKMST